MHLLKQYIIYDKFMKLSNIQRDPTGTGRGGLHPSQLWARTLQTDALHWRRTKKYFCNIWMTRFHFVLLNMMSSNGRFTLWDFSFYPPWLCVLLHYGGDSLDKLPCGNGLLVNQVVLLCQFPGSPHQNPTKMTTYSLIWACELWQLYKHRALLTNTM